MAAYMIYRHQQHKKTKNNALLAKFHEIDNDSKLLEKNHLEVIYYGFMLYTLNYQDSLTITHDKVVSVNKHIDIVAQNVANTILILLKENKKARISFYQTKNMNPKMVSYNIVMKHCKYVNIYVNKNYKRKLCYIYGDKDLKVYILLY